MYNVLSTLVEHAVANMGLSEDEASEIIEANQRAYDRILQALLKVDAYNWQVGAMTKHVVQK